jgi:hypothetical protein
LSALNIGELYGPLSPVRLSSTSALLESLVAKHTPVDSLEHEHEGADLADSSLSHLPVEQPGQEVLIQAVGNASVENASIVEPDSVVDDDSAVSSPTSEILQDKSAEESFEILTRTSTTQTHIVPSEEQKLVPAVAQVEDASNDEPISEVSAKVANPLMTDFSSSNITTASRDENLEIPLTSTTTARRKHQSCDKSSFHRHSRSAAQNFLKDLGFIRKNGKLNEDKLQDFADLLKELLPPDLLLSLLSLKGRVFWETVAKIFDTLC